MKKLSLLLLSGLLSMPSMAKIHLGAEVGYAMTNTNSKNTGLSSQYLGIMAGKKFKIVTVDLGLRYWGSNSEAKYDYLNALGMPMGAIDYTSKVNNLSIPISAGIYLPVKKFNILAKAVLAPTFVTSHKHDFNDAQLMLPSGFSIDYEPGTTGYYTAAGGEVGIGYSFTSRFSIDLKYSYLTFLSDLKQENTKPTGFPFYKAPVERPVMHGIGIQANIFL